MELELAVLLFFAIVGQSSFAHFEIETPALLKVAKWTVMSVVTLAFTRVVGHWALAFPIAMGIAGSTFHVWWCRRHGIDPIRATPRRKYYELRGWPWPEAAAAAPGAANNR